MGELPVMSSMPMSSEAMTAAMASPLMANPAALQGYANLGALPFTTQQALLNGTYGSAAMGQRMDGQLADLTAYQSNFNAAHMAQYQASLPPSPRAPHRGPLGVPARRRRAPRPPSRAPRATRRTRPSS